MVLLIRWVEILVEKVWAVFHREGASDLYDLWFLVGRWFDCGVAHAYAWARASPSCFQSFNARRESVDQNVVER